MPTDPTTRDNLILDHIGLYRLTFRRTLERLFFNGAAGASGNVVQRLLDDGRIQARSGLPGRLSYYQLTASEAAGRVVPIGRTRALKSQALHQAIAVLWHCCMTGGGTAGGPRRRVRIEPAELKGLIEGFPDAPQAAHCLEVGDPGDGHRPAQPPRIMRLEVVGSRTGIAGLVQRLTGRIHEAKRHPHLGDWVTARRYGYVVLADAQRRRELIERAIEKVELRRIAAVSVAFAPTPVSVVHALREIQ